MALRARLSAPKKERDDWPWHRVKWGSFSSSLFTGGDRRMEADNYLSGGYGVRLALESKKAGWLPLSEFATIWQPSRLKGIQVSAEFGTPFLAATQVFDLRPVPRKFLSLDKTDSAQDRFIESGMIVVTCSGNVGRATLGNLTHKGILVSHDLLRVEPKEQRMWGWIYAYLRSPIARSIMNAAQYGHVIKHLEVSHLNALPIPIVRDDLLEVFHSKAKKILEARNEAFELLTQAESIFAEAIGVVEIDDIGEEGFSVKASSLFSGRRRLEGFYHNPQVTTLRKHFQHRGLVSEKLTRIGCSVWLPNRFKRISAEDGVALLDSSDLFEINPEINRHIADGNFGDPYKGRVKAGWLLVSRSGQIYGLNGSVAIANSFHEDKVVSDDVIRIAVSDDADLRAGYLYIAMSHPTLGRPLVKAQIYGSSIPHLDVADVREFELVRLPKKIEDKIADLAEKSSALQAHADILEIELAEKAESILQSFIDGDYKDIVLAPK